MGLHDNVQLWFMLYLTHTGHTGHLAVAGVQTVFLTTLREEEIDFIIISDRAVHTLPHQSRLHKISFCTGPNISVNVVCVQHGEDDMLWKTSLYMSMERQ